MNKGTGILLAALLLVPGALHAAGAPRPATGGKAVILADDQGWGDVSGNGNPSPWPADLHDKTEGQLTMPHILQRTIATIALMAGLVAVISTGSAFGATWEESFDGKFAKKYYVEPQLKGKGWTQAKINPASGYSDGAGEVSLVETPTRRGKGAMKCVRKEEGSRMELELVNRDEKESPRLNQHCWAGISILIPKSGAANGQMCIQWHGGMPGLAQGKEYGHGPECCLRVKDGQFVFHNTSKASKAAEAVQKVAAVVEEAKPGAWYDFVFHHYFSLKDDGLIEIWVNGKKVYTQKGCNVFYYRSKFAFKFGLYASGTPGALYFDEAKVVTGSGSYEQVSPGGAKPMASPSPRTADAPSSELDGAGTIVVPRSTK